MHSYEFQMYRNFDELAIDMIELAKEIMPDKLVYLTEFPSGKAHSFRGGMKARQDAECQ